MNTQSTEGSFASQLDRYERSHDHVLLVTTAPEGAWGRFCIRQADRRIVLTEGGAVPAGLARQTGLHGCDLVFSSPHQTQATKVPWVSALQPRGTYTASQGDDGPIAELARRIAGRSVGLVLSGGGARGFAHIGVLEELEDAGVVVDRVGGCSMGAFVGAMFAMGLSPSAIRARCQEEFVDGNPYSDYGVPRVSLLRGRKAVAMLLRTFDRSAIEELPREFFCVSCDLLTAELVVHRRGPVFESVGASMSLPGVFAPIARENRLLVDGGVLNNLPVAPMDTGEGPIIAVDVTARFRPAGDEHDTSVTSNPTWAFRNRRIDHSLPSIKETLTRAIGIGSVGMVAESRQRADLLIAPETGSVGMTEFRKLDHMVDAGRRAARAALAMAPMENFRPIARL